MKKNIVYVVAGILFGIFTSGLYAQEPGEKSNKSEQKELQEQQEKQLKTLQEFMKQNMEKQRKALEKMREEFDQKASSERDFFYGKNNWSGRGYIPPSSSNKSSTLTLRKTLKKQTGVSGIPFKFEVDEKVTSIRFTVSGSVNNKDGFIKIDITSPDKKEYKSFFIRNTADITWTQTLRITNENKKKYVGKWGIAIAAHEAEGDYNVTITTF